MNSRHAAALALVGWYLILPPLEVHQLDEKAPISLWDKVGTYDTETACKEQAALLRLRHAKVTDPLLKKHFALGLCIASDDPRLKGK